MASSVCETLGLMPLPKLVLRYLCALAITKKFQFSEEPAINFFPQIVAKMHPNAKLKVVYFQAGSASLMPLSQCKECNKLFGITPDIMLGELHRMGPDLILCIFLKFLILLEGFILLSSGLLPSWS